METITQSLTRIEKIIYTLPYDELTGYLQGIRDIINPINGEEPNDLIADTVIRNLKDVIRNYAERE